MVECFLQNHVLIRLEAGSSFYRTVGEGIIVDPIQPDLDQVEKKALYGVMMDSRTLFVEAISEYLNSTFEIE